jgi:hypothetical protein
LHEFSCGGKSGVEIARSLFVVLGELVQQRVPRHARRIGRQVREGLFHLLPGHADLLRLEADACVPDDRGCAFGIVALDMSHQHDTETDGFAVNKTLSARFFDGPREDVLRAAIEAGLRMGREALGELRANLENLDERVKPLRADGRRLIAQSFKRVAGGSFEVLIPLSVDAGFVSDLPIVERRMAAKDFGGTGPVHPRRRCGEQIGVEDKLQRDWRLPLGDACTVVKGPGCAGETGIVRGRAQDLRQWSARHLGKEFCRIHRNPTA